ncbi:SDR family NAD(P)-dependent oxidoreductase, partial [Nostoc sp. FACHB-145]|uniref:SDR family NAD(P)-dependent oxidoreductase n=1 Tax=Nostoc sp. FACHB-145 TaxID=2692836 RepID=UPI001684D338
LIPLMKINNYGRIVNVSTEMASLSTIASDYYPLAPSYRLSKIGVNGLTVLLAKELQGGNILVNAYSPGWMKTDMGGDDAPFTAEEGAETAVYLATLPDGGAQGQFFAEMRKFGGPIQLQW